MKISVLQTININNLTCSTLILLTFLISCRTSEKYAFTTLKNTENLELYESYLNDYPTSKNFKVVLQEYQELYNERFVRLPPSPRNCAEIYITSDSLLCIDGKRIPYNEFYSTYENFLSKEWVGKEGISTHIVKYVPVNSLDTLYYSRGYFQIHYNSDEVLNSVQKVAIQCKRLLDNYNNEIALKWYDKPYKQITKTERNTIDSVIYSFHKIVYVKYDFCNECVCNPPPPGPSYPDFIIIDERINFELPEDELEIINE